MIPKIKNFESLQKDSRLLNPLECNETQAMPVFGWVHFRKWKKMTVWLWSCHKMLWVWTSSILPSKFRYNVWKSRFVLITKEDIKFALVMLKSKGTSLSVYWSCWKVAESRLTGRINLDGQWKSNFKVQSYRNGKFNVWKLISTRKGLKIGHTAFGFNRSM